MAKHPVMIEYAYELKENLARRAIALFIDLVVVGVPLFILFVFLGLGVLQANPMNAIFGLLGPVFYQQQVQGIKETSPFISMIVFVILQTFMLPLYYSWRESNSRRTVGKKLMHLDPIRKDGMFPTRWDGLQRNYLKYFMGAIGGYLLGFIGWFLFIGIACLIDLKIAPEYKFDLRQRITETPFKTAALNERPEVAFGEIAIDKGKWAKLKEKEEKAKKYAKRLKREEKMKKKMSSLESRSKKKKKDIESSLEKTSERTEKILEDVKKKKGARALPTDLEEDSGKKKKPRRRLTARKAASTSREEEDLDLDLDEEDEDEDLPLKAPGKEEKSDKAIPLEAPTGEEKAEEEETEEEPKEKVSFFKRLFGGGKKKEPQEEEKEDDTGGQKEGKGSETGLPDLAPTKKDSRKDEIVLQFMMEFDIDEERAKGLYDMGYRQKEELKDAIPQDLMMIEGVNPTIAKRIIKRANK